MTQTTINDLESTTNRSSTHESSNMPLLPETNVAEKSNDTKPRPKVIGIYGVSGSGKTTLINKLKLESQLKDKDKDKFSFHDGSTMIQTVFNGPITDFQQASPTVQTKYRELAIQHITQNREDKTPIIAGHAMFWNAEHNASQLIWTDADTQTYTHIIYLALPIALIHQYRLNDTSRRRTPLSFTQLQDWQAQEVMWLRRKCYENSIVFCCVRSEANLVEDVANLLEEFNTSSEANDIDRAKQILDSVIGQESAETTIVLDGDRTLSASDTGQIFWNIAAENNAFSGITSPLDEIFQNQPEYCYASFQQANLLYRETFTPEEFNLLCQKTAARTSIYPEFISFLNSIIKHTKINIILITCGLELIWKEMLKSQGLSDHIKVIGGGRSKDAIIVTPNLKARLVQHLQQEHEKYIWAFGDSPIDIPMLQQANQAIVVVGDIGMRSRSMDNALRKSIGYGFRPYQVLLPVTSPPRLDVTLLPSVELTYEVFMELDRNRDMKFVDATNTPSTLLLSTPMRDSKISGPALQHAHETAGAYLATTYISEHLGLEPYTITHVLGSSVSGYRLHHESNTTIIALMRGGEPMARGVGKVFPSAMFVHAKHTSDLQPCHLANQSAVILVDSVINTGKSIKEFMVRINELSPGVKIVVVAGVVQKEAVKVLREVGRGVKTNQVSLVALRVSETRFAGKGGTDTGNRLFGTVRLD